MEAIVLDASVGAKWLFDEDQSDKARILFDFFNAGKIKVIVPEFFFVELANVCCRKIKGKSSLFDSTMKGFDEICELPFEKYPDIELSGVAMDNAFIHKISLYDAIYVSLAEIYLAPLITADAALVKRVKSRFDFIELLKDR